jgi:hypothetical protein
MKKKWVLALAGAGLALGAGVGVYTGVLPGWRRAPAPEPAESPLVIEVNPESIKVESGVEGHRDVPFRNRTDRPATVRLERTDCDCVHVLACVVPDAGGGSGGRELLKRADDPALTWQMLGLTSEGFKVPPGAAGLFRVTWKAVTVGDHLFWGMLLVEDGPVRGRQRVEAAVTFVQPVNVRTEDDPKAAEVDVGVLKAGEERTVRFVCSSTTRDKFTLMPVSLGDPCLVCGTPQPLSREELAALTDKAGDPVRAAYRVSVTVRERADGSRLDIGPFRRAAVLRSNVYPGHEVRPRVSGTVRGEVSLEAPGGKAFVDLGSLLPLSPKPVTFTLRSPDPGLVLGVDEKRTAEFLRVALLDGPEGKAADGGKSWRVRVVFRTDSLYRGQFPSPDNPDADPATCAAVFTVAHPGPAGPPAVRLVVPVRGTARPY